MTLKIFVPAMAMVATLAWPLGAQAPANNASLATAFGAREEVSDIALSPDGQHIAMVSAGPGHSDRLYVVEAVEGAQPNGILSSNGEPQHLQYCYWVSNARLVCSTGGVSEYNGDLYGHSAMIAVDADGKNVQSLEQRRGQNALGADFRGGRVIDLLPDEDGSVLMMRSYVPEAKIGSMISKDEEGIGLDRIDTRTGRTRPVEKPTPDTSSYITDGHGNVRIWAILQRAGTGYDRGLVKYMYRRKGSNNWQELSLFNYADDRGFFPVAVDGDLDIAYGFDKLSGRRALVSIKLDGSMTREVVLDRSDVDVDDLMRVGRGQRVIGTSFLTDRREAVYFDPKYKALAASLGKALGGKAVGIVDASADENRLLLRAGSDVEPDRYYLFDKAAHTLSPVMSNRPALEGVTLAEQRSVSYKAADGTMIPAYLTLPAGSSGKGLPAIVMPHGGPSARDEWGFDWLPQYFAARGFAVLQPQFRGSSGYGDDWVMQNGFKSWRTAIGDVTDAGHWLVSSGIADPKKLTIFGWSYGGYAALQSAVTEPGLFKAVVAVAPVTDMDALLEDSRYYSNFTLVRDSLPRGAEARAGSPAPNAATITAPVLMFHGTLDQNVDIQQSRLMQSRLTSAGKRSELVVYEGLTHNLNDSNARAQMLQRSGDFLMAAGQ